MFLRQLVIIILLIAFSFVFIFFGPPLFSETKPKQTLHEKIAYGKELISKTSFYLGPKGTVGTYLGNSMSCQNCHLDAGTRPYGGSFFGTYARYPQWREREGRIINLADRINLCIQRPHQGKPLPVESNEMEAMQLYIKWLGEDPKWKEALIFSELIPYLPNISRRADSVRGNKLYLKHCKQCHGEDGLGQRTVDEVSYIYPPLWGPDSYGIGSSMHRIRKLAAFLKFNMPFGTKWDNPVLSDDEAYDLAAFINNDQIHPRKQYDISKDYPRKSDKAIDYPFGPYADPFSEDQHKYGPWGPIMDWRKK